MPVLDMRLGLPGEGTAPKHETERQAYDLITKGFGAGTNGPLTVVAELPSNSGPAAAESVATDLGKLSDVAKVGKPASTKANRSR